MSQRPQRLKRMFQSRQAALLPGTPNALFARVIEDLGFAAAYVTGAGIANMHLGAPDIGLVTMTELADQVAAIADAVEIPLLVDGDTGFGNPINTGRAVRLIERFGAAGLQLEDQVFPKKCGHFSGKAVIPADEMVQKIKAAVDARHDEDFQIVARTDCRSIDGLDAALERAARYIDAGADVTFVEAPVSPAELARIATDLPAPQIANIVHGGLTPPLPQTELAELGFGGVLYANAALQAALHSVRHVLSELREHGSLDTVRSQLASFAERQEVVRKDKYDALEAKYR